MSEHKIFPHGGLEEVSPGVWTLKGSLAFPLPRYMTVLRLKNGDLMIYSAIALDEAGMKALEKIGKPSVLLVPHTYHLMDAPYFKTRYPDIKVVAAPDARKRLEGTVKVDATPEEALPDLGLKFHTIPGMKVTEIVLDLALEGGGRGLVFTDLLGHGNAKGLMMKLLGPPGGEGVARIVRMRQMAKKSETRAWLESIGSPDLKLVLMAHSRPRTERTNELLQVAASRL